MGRQLTLRQLFNLISLSLKGHKKNEVQKISCRKSKSSQQESIAEDLVQRRSATTHEYFPPEPANRHVAQQPSRPNLTVPDSDNTTRNLPTYQSRLVIPITPLNNRTLTTLLQITSINYVPVIQICYSIKAMLA